MADAKPDDIKDLLGGALFKALFKWMQESGPVYLLPTGPISSFLVISDPDCAKHVLRASDNPNRPIYDKGLVAGGLQVSVWGGVCDLRRRSVAGAAACSGAVTASRLPGSHVGQGVRPLRSGSECQARGCGGQWGRHRHGGVLLPAHPGRDWQSGVQLRFQRAHNQLSAHPSRVHEPEGDGAARHGFTPILEDPLSGGLHSPAAEGLGGGGPHSADHRGTHRQVQGHGGRGGGGSLLDEGYINDADPSILRFLIASREEVSSVQLRDDLLSMLVAGHETTGSALTWTLYLLVNNPDKLAKAQAEVDSVLGGGKKLGVAEYGALRYVLRCVCESMRLYPHPPVLLRRAQVEDTLPGEYMFVGTARFARSLVVMVNNIRNVLACRFLLLLLTVIISRLCVSRWVQGAAGSGRDDICVQHPPFPCGVGRRGGVHPRTVWAAGWPGP